MPSMKFTTFAAAMPQKIHHATASGPATPVPPPGAAPAEAAGGGGRMRRQPQPDRQPAVVIDPPMAATPSTPANARQ